MPAEGLPPSTVQTLPARTARGAGAGRPGPLALVALTVAVTAAHLWLANSAEWDHFGLGPDAKLPARMQVSFVQELAQRAPAAYVSAPPAATATARAQPPARKAAAAAAAASQAAASPQGHAPEPVALPPPEPPASAAEFPAAAAVASATSAASAAPAVAAPSAATAGLPTPLPADAAQAAAPGAPEPATANEAPPTAQQAFAWPPSTRLSYTLTGNYRGPVEGQAQVEWLLEGGRYQVHMDLSIGPAFAPLASRRVSSEGVVTAQGLAPRRYDEVTRALFRQDQQVTVWLDEDRVRLASGTAEPRPAGVQDSASQFVHLTWLFTTQPGLLRVGQSITLPLALPRVLEPWVYDVLGAETLATPAGAVETFHVKPRRPPRPGRDLTAEMWVAPSLQYLPVRIVIRQDDQTYLDLLIARLPQQAAGRR